MNVASVNQADEELNVCLQGALLNTGNMGCSALTVSLVKLLSDLKPNCRIYLLYSAIISEVKNLTVSGRTVPVNVVNCRLSPKSRLN